MIFLKSTLAGLAALIVVAVIICGLGIGVPLILELIPFSGGGGGFFVVSFRGWVVVTALLLIFSAGFYWGLRRFQRQP